MVGKMFRGLTSERNAIHKHDTIVIKLQKNKCCTRLFELYWTDTFQRVVKHCSDSYESRKNKIIHINIHWWIRNIHSNHRISEFKCDLNSNRFSSKTCIAFRILVILYTYGLYVDFIPYCGSLWYKTISKQTMCSPKLLCLPPVTHTLRDLDMRFTWVLLTCIKRQLVLKTIFFESGGFTQVLLYILI